MQKPSINTNVFKIDHILISCVIQFLYYTIHLIILMDQSVFNEYKAGYDLIKSEIDFLMYLHLNNPLF